MKLHALLTFLLALPLFVRVLPEAVDESASVSTPSVTPAEPAPESKAPAKRVETPAPKSLEKPAESKGRSTEPTH